MVVRLVVQIAFRPRRAIVEHISQLSQRILFVAEKVGRRTIHDGIHLAMSCTEQLICQMNHIVEVGTVIVIILQMQDRVFVSILESKRTVQVVAETVVHLVWRTVERKPKVTALLKTLQGELVEFVVQLAQSFHLGSSRMKHHLVERHLTKPKQVVQELSLRLTEVSEEIVRIVLFPIHHLLDTTFHLLHDGTLILYRRLFSYKVYKFEVRLRTIATVVLNFINQFFPFLFHLLPL